MPSNDPARPGLSDRVRSLRLAGRDGSAPSRTRALPWVFSFVLLLTTIAFGYRAYRVGSLPTADAPRAEAKKDDAPAAPATTGVAAAGEVVLQAKGYVVPISQVQVSPKVGGQIVWMDERFKEGEKFKKDDVLARLERVDYESDHNQALFAVESATARWEELKRTMPEEVKQAEAELEESRATATQQKLEVDRNRRLTLTSAIAQREMEQTRYAYDATMARIRKLEATLRMIKEGRFEKRVQAAEAEMRQAKAFLAKAKWRLDNTEIKATVSGSILTKKAELGNIVNPSAFSSGISASLCEMADLKELEIDLSIQERDVRHVQPRQVCWVMPDAYKDDEQFLSKHPKGYRGEVSRLMPYADRAKGAVPVRVYIVKGEISEEEAGRYLRPDLSATVSFLRAPASTEKGRGEGASAQRAGGLVPAVRTAETSPAARPNASPTSGTKGNNGNDPRPENKR
jgi:HlyD family secretion protein